MSADLVSGRSDRGGSLDRGALGRLQWPGVRHLGHPRHPLPADPAHAARGPAGRHVAAPRLRRLHTQTGERAMRQTGEGDRVERISFHF